MKLIFIFLFSFQSINVPIDYYFDSSNSIIYFLYKNKIDSYNIGPDFKLISSYEINNSNLYDLSKFKFVNQFQLSSKLGGSILKIDGDSVYRIDNSYEHKMQLGSLEFVRNDTIHRYGGYGFFQNRNFFTFFDKQTNGWEFLNINGSTIPEEIFGYIHHLTNDRLFICGGYKLDKFKNDLRHKNYDCYEFDFYTKKWKILGSLNDHIEKMKNSFLYNNNTQITFNNGEMYKLNFDSNLIESFSPNPVTKKIESSYFKPFIHNSQLNYFNIQNDQLEIKSISLKNFEISLKKKYIKNLYETSYWVYSSFFALIVISIIVIFQLIIKFINKIIKFNNLYYYNFTRIPFNSYEEILFDILMNSSKTKSKVPNRILIDIFTDQSLDYGTITRKKNESISNLNEKLKILFKTKKNIIIREYSQIDRREINYSINPYFI